MTSASLQSVVPASLLFFFTLELHVIQCAALTTKEGHFTRVILCSDVLPGTTSLLKPKNTKLACALHCTEDNACTAFTFVPDGTCNLHTDDVTANICPTNSTLSVHYKKIVDTSITTPTTIPTTTTTTSTTTTTATTTTTSTTITTTGEVTTGHYCLNGGSLINSGTACQCVGGYVGDYCERIMEDCDEGLASGQYPNMDGVYLIHPPASPSPFSVYCHHTVRHFIHMKYDGSTNFNVTMANYIDGFGNMNGDFFLGLEKLHLLTTSRFYTLGVQVSNYTSQIYQRYYVHFQVQNASTGYAMTFSNQYPPQAPALPMGDCFTPLMSIPFSAYDDDNDGNSTRNCAADYGGGFWYNGACSDCNLMGTVRWSDPTRVPEAVDELFWNPGLDPTFSPSSAWMFMFRTP